MLTFPPLLNANHIFLIYYLFVAFLLHRGLAKLRNDDGQCDKVILSNNSGRIVSPNITLGPYVSYPNLASCAWYIENQPGMTITLSFRQFDIEEGQQFCDHKPCCGDTWLSISSLQSRPTASLLFKPSPVHGSVNLLYCGRDLSLPPLIFSGSGLIITFQTGPHVAGGKGFIIDYLIDKKVRHKCDGDRFHCTNGKCILSDWMCNGWDECGDGSDERNCTKLCENGLTRCNHSSSFCYNYNKDRCNGILDCPGGEDEQSCAFSCGDRLSCRSRGGCFNPLQRCDGIRDCLDSSDEEGCDMSLCGPHRDGFLCRNRRCISALMRCDGIQDCGDYSDEETCMKMSVVTAVILGSLLCGLLLVIATGCGLRLYHLRVALEQRWSAIRQQQHLLHNDFDEFGRRRPIMGRQPPPTYAQAMGNVAPVTSNLQISVPVSAIPRHPSHRSRRHSRRSRRPALLPPSAAAQDAAVRLEEAETAPAADGADPETPPSLDGGGFVARVLRRWRKHWTPSGSGTVSSDAIDNTTAPVSVASDVLVLEHVQAAFQTNDEIDTEPLIESHP